MQKRKRPYRIETVERCFSILESVASLNGGTVDSQTLQSMTSLPMPTLFRFVSFLTDLDYLHRDHLGRFSLGRRTFKFGTPHHQHAFVRRIARPIILRLAKSLGETVRIGVLKGPTIAILDTSGIKDSFQSALNSRLHAHSTALGKVLLAQLSEPAFVSIFPEPTLPALTSRTIRARSVLQRRLVEYRHNRISYDEQETFDDICCIGCHAIQDNDLAVAISVSSAATKWVTRRVRLLEARILAAADEIRASYEGGSRSPALLNPLSVRLIDQE